MTAWYDGEAPVLVLHYLQVHSNSGMKVPIRVRSIGQMDLFEIYLL